MKPVLMADILAQNQKAVEMAAAVELDAVESQKVLVRYQAEVNAARDALDSAQLRLSYGRALLASGREAAESMKTKRLVAAEMQEAARAMAVIFPMLEEAKGTTLCIGDAFSMDGLAGLCDAHQYYLSDFNGVLNLLGVHGRIPTITAQLAHYSNFKLPVKFSFVSRAVAGAEPGLIAKLVESSIEVLNQWHDAQVAAGQAALDITEFQAKTTKLARSVMLLQDLGALVPSGEVAVGDRFSVAIVGKLGLLTAAYALCTEGPYYYLRSLYLDRPVLHSLQGELAVSITATYCPPHN